MNGFPDLYEQVHVNDIRPGDTVVIDGTLKTVCQKDIRTGGFCGATLFGDSHRLGTAPVTRVIFSAELARRAKNATKGLTT